MNQMSAWKRIRPTSPPGMSVTDERELRKQLKIIAEVRHIGICVKRELRTHRNKQTIGSGNLIVPPYQLQHSINRQLRVSVFGVQSYCDLFFSHLGPADVCRIRGGCRAQRNQNANEDVQRR